MYKRDIVKTIKTHMNEPCKFIQIVIGPRQTGKTTAVTQALKEIDLPYVFSEVSEIGSSQDWVRAQWYQARNNITPESPEAVLVIDEIQYVENWSSVVKELWDEDRCNNLDLRVILTGSSATLLKSGLNESLMGRFEVIHCTHWTYSECKEAFDFSLDEFLYFGGYPGAENLRAEEERWRSYINNAIIEPCISKDVLALNDIRNPALLRRLFFLGAPYSAQEVSYRKLLGQLDDKGNTATIAHYLELLDLAGILSGIQKYNPKLIRQKASSPRLMVHNTALMTAQSSKSFERYMANSEARGHLVESAIGAYLLTRAKTDFFNVFWYRDGNKEVDFVLSKGEEIIAIEVKSGRVKSTKGMTDFIIKFPKCRSIIIGSEQCSIEDFLLRNIPLF